MLEGGPNEPVVLCRSQKRCFVVTRSSWTGSGAGHRAQVRRSPRHAEKSCTSRSQRQVDSEIFFKLDYDENAPAYSPLKPLLNPSAGVKSNQNSHFPSPPVSRIISWIRGQVGVRVRNCGRRRYQVQHLWPRRKRRREERSRSQHFRPLHSNDARCPDRARLQTDDPLERSALARVGPHRSAGQAGCQRRDARACRCARSFGRVPRSRLRRTPNIPH